VESGKLVLEDAEFDLGRELEGLVDMFSVQCINHNVETVLDLSGMILNLVATYEVLTLRRTLDTTLKCPYRL
jgi:hypothetical protein